jgi:hypothetical protein
MKTKNIKIERKVTVEMARHGWKIAPDGKVYVGSRMMTVSAAREMVRQNKAAQAGEWPPRSWRIVAWETL